MGAGRRREPAMPAHRADDTGSWGSSGKGWDAGSVSCPSHTQTQPLLPRCRSNTGSASGAGSRSTIWVGCRGAGRQHTFSERTPSRTAAGSLSRLVCRIACATRCPPRSCGAPSGAVRKIRREYRCPPSPPAPSCRKLRSTATSSPGAESARATQRTASRPVSA